MNRSKSLLNNLTLILFSVIFLAAISWISFRALREPSTSYLTWTIEHVEEIVSEEGSDTWFEGDPSKKYKKINKNYIDKINKEVPMIRSIYVGDSQSNPEIVLDLDNGYRIMDSQYARRFFPGLVVINQSGNYVLVAR
jgi:hypothetical protein